VDDSLVDVILTTESFLLQQHMSKQAHPQLHIFCCYTTSQNQKQIYGQMHTMLNNNCNTDFLLDTDILY